MTKRIYNFSAGPSVLPLPVLERAKDEMLSYRGTGMSVMELSHRSDEFGEILANAERGLRNLLNIPDHYRILFLPGGASLQFNMVPLNFLRDDGPADYVITGSWGKKAFYEARRCGDARVVYSAEETGFTSVPPQAEVRLTPGSNYVHYTSNETIEGVEFTYDLDGSGVPVICDASSNILSKWIDVEKYELIYAGAQKNIGPSGVTVVIIRDDLVKAVPQGQHAMLDYRLFAEQSSMPNTPNTWGIYLIGLVCEWLLGRGGVKEIENTNRRKAERLYKAIDGSDGFYLGHAKREARSAMNVTFRLPSPQLERRFCSEATAQDLVGLQGHRSVGGVRASIYNAFPEEGVDRLIEFMSDFAAQNA